MTYQLIPVCDRSTSAKPICPLYVEEIYVMAIFLFLNLDKSRSPTSVSNNRLQKPASLKKNPEALNRNTKQQNAISYLKP